MFFKNHWLIIILVLTIFSLILIGSSLESKEKEKSLEFDKTYSLFKDKLTDYEKDFELSKSEEVQLNSIRYTLKTIFNSIKSPTLQQISEHNYTICSLETYASEYTTTSCDTKLIELDEATLKKMEFYSKLKTYRVKEYRSLKKEEKISLLQELKEGLDTFYGKNYPNRLEFLTKHDTRINIKNTYFSLLLNISDELYNLGDYKSTKEILTNIFGKTSGYTEELDKKLMSIALIQINIFHKLKTKDSFQDVWYTLSYGIMPYYYNEDFAKIISRELKVYFDLVKDTNDYNVEDYKNIFGHILESKYSTRMEGKKLLVDTNKSLDYIEVIINNIGVELLNKGNWNDSQYILAFNYFYNKEEQTTRNNLILISKGLISQKDYRSACSLLQSLYIDSKLPKEKGLKETYISLLPSGFGPSCRENSGLDRLSSLINYYLGIPSTSYDN